jgi:hypothetical protein
MPDLDPLDWLLAERDRVVAERRALETDESTMSTAPPDTGASKYLFLAATELKILRERMELATRVMSGRVGTVEHIDIVFDGPPDHIAPKFIEVENDKGASINFGEWIKRDDGYHVIRIRRADVADLK